MAVGIVDPHSGPERGPDSKSDARPTAAPAELIDSVERLTFHRFNDAVLLSQSLTHSSFSNESAPKRTERRTDTDNERLEFLGDAVIGLVVARELMSLFPTASEGKLSRWRSSLVSRKALAEIAVTLKLGDLVRLGRGERQTGGAEKRSILAAALEALVGAIYLDGGIDKAGAFLKHLYAPYFEMLQQGNEQLVQLVDRKTHLQEKTQSMYRSAPLYRLVESWGPEHEKFFRVEILVEGRVVATGEGRSKKDAEQQAASLALEILGF